MGDSVRSWIFGILVFVASMAAMFYFLDGKHLFPFDVVAIPAVIALFLSATIVEIPVIGRILTPEYARARANNDNKTKSGPYYDR